MSKNKVTPVARSKPSAASMDSKELYCDVGVVNSPKPIFELSISDYLRTSQIIGPAPLGSFLSQRAKKEQEQLLDPQYAVNYLLVEYQDQLLDMRTSTSSDRPVPHLTDRQCILITEKKPDPKTKIKDELFSTSQVSACQNMIDDYVIITNNEILLNDIKTKIDKYKSEIHKLDQRKLTPTPRLKVDMTQASYVTSAPITLATLENIVKKLHSQSTGIFSSKENELFKLSSVPETLPLSKNQIIYSITEREGNDVSVAFYTDPTNNKFVKETVEKAITKAHKNKENTDTDPAIVKPGQHFDEERAALRSPKNSVDNSLNVSLNSDGEIKSTHSSPGKQNGSSNHAYLPMSALTESAIGHDALKEKAKSAGISN